MCRDAASGLSALRSRLVGSLLILELFAKGYLLRRKKARFVA